LVWNAGKLDFTDPKERQHYFEEFGKVAAMLHQHANDEDAFIQPLIEQCAPDTGHELEIQHQRSDEFLKCLEIAVEKMKDADSIAAATWQSFLDRLNQFVGDYYLHLYHEESIAMPLLWEAHEDHDLIAVSIKLRNQIPSHIQSNFQRYMIPALNVHEQTMILASARRSVPEPVFQEMCRLFELLLQPKEWEDVRTRLAVG